MKGLVFPVLAVGMLAVTGIVISSQLQNRQSSVSKAYEPKAVISCYPRFYINDSRNRPEQYYLDGTNLITGNEITYDDLKKSNFEIVVMPRIINEGPITLNRVVSEGNYTTNKLVDAVTVDKDYSCITSGNKFRCDYGDDVETGRVPSGGFRLKLDIPGGPYSKGRNPKLHLNYSVNSTETRKMGCSTSTLTVVLRPPV